jgi:hypothetical protein
MLIPPLSLWNSSFGRIPLGVEMDETLLKLPKVPALSTFTYYY